MKSLLAASAVTCGLALTLGGALVAAQEPAAPAMQAASAAARAFRFEYRARVPAPEGAKRLDAWIPLPIEDAHQSVADLSIETTCAGERVAHEVGKDEPYGNRMVHVGLDAPRGDLVLAWRATVRRRPDASEGTGPVLARYLEADALVPVTGRAKDLAHEVKADAAEDAVRDRAKRVYDHVLSTMVYDKSGTGWGRGDFDHACDVGRGNCTDFHAKFTGIARAAGIPVRFTMGVPLSTDARGAPAGYHCWAHFHDGKAWIPVDASDAQKVVEKDPAKAQWFFGHLDPDRLALTVGRDLALVPRQKGPPLAFFVYPYAEADGKAIEVRKENRFFAFENR